MEARLNAYASPTLTKLAKHLVSVDKELENSTLPTSTRQLVEIRASQINGCAFCLDMHTKDAAAAGADAVRINLVSTWREATVFTAAERAALALAEAGTRLADSAGVPDDVWAQAAEHYDEEQLGALVTTIAVINAFNRGNVLIKQPAGDYVPGRFH